MNPSSVYSKTAKGLDEIATRTHGLAARRRALLIMVDGHRTVSELLALSTSTKDAERQLAALLNEGFIQHEAASIHAAAAAAQPDPAPPDEDISLTKSYIVQTLRELLGSQAGALITEIEKARNVEELQGQVGKLLVALGAAADQKKVRHFLDELALVLA
ncbi:conserved hypothetical protein [Candidatus Accumulibacter aalborgensis]|uniref:Uncharacterized protein n=1 Tax=Candidatus Accumulibacter aalborgensis TaxID=1860102 RepID=A0A1A8XEW2_9PROT|nr:hypothetical protein [Candidatus Accumulibacter aalborgensis]SBT03724.1 conserved hypothetical protein [Candidatus Accumulibacter aalborgensis]